ncbi:TPA: hypothetical protein ACQ49P_005116 [Pseudomonas aeruginosa]
MKKHTLLAAVVASGSILLSGCATTDMQAAMGQINGSLSELGKALATPGAEGSGPAVSSIGRSGSSMTKTKLMGVFSRSPSTDGRAPEWPKVAITNLSIPAEQASASRARLKAGDCVVFDAVLWYDAKNNEKFNDVSLCAPELPKRSNDFVTTWRTFPISGKTSGQVRGEGPTPPYSKLPSDSLMDRWMTGPGIYFVGSMLTMMGYDPQFSVDDRRFWVKNVRGS